MYVFNLFNRKCTEEERNKLQVILTGDVSGVIDGLFKGFEDELAVDQVFEEALHARTPRVLGSAAVLAVGIAAVAIAVSELHGDESHLFDDAFGFAGVGLSVPSPLVLHRSSRSR